MIIWVMEFENKVICSYWWTELVLADSTIDAAPDIVCRVSHLQRRRKARARASLKCNAQPWGTHIRLDESNFYT